MYVSSIREGGACMNKYIQALIFTVLFFGIGAFLCFAITWAIKPFNPVIWALVGVLVVLVYLNMLKLVKGE